MRRICTVCARGGSKGIPGKNRRPIAGKPLIAWTLEMAVGCGFFDRVVVSSDDEAILTIGRDYGADLVVRRPDDLATDTISKLPAIIHAVMAAESSFGEHYDVIVDTDATSPLRIADDIAGALALFDESGVTSVITGAPARRSPYFNLVEERSDGTVAPSKSAVPPIQRRQDAPRCFDMNASIYVWRREPFLSDPQVFYGDTILFEMPEERSIDIDTPLDFLFVEQLL
ncbi:MAG TPA: acylneuraminate cytidylyltransferase family protein, partial [Hyphomicrobiales bacterium]|nr:acylneuraminate cytidylyltransferase family protein [Hyphomicrobiales bacterium]